MANVERAEISKKNPYYISRYRYYELRYYCLQYPDWRSGYIEAMSNPLVTSDKVINFKNRNYNLDPVYNVIEKAYGYKYKMESIDNVINSNFEEATREFVKLSVTKNYPYSYFQTVMNIPYSKNTFYDMRRKFFWLLDQSHN